MHSQQPESGQCILLNMLKWSNHYGAIIDVWQVSTKIIQIMKLLRCKSRFNYFPCAVIIAAFFFCFLLATAWCCAPGQKLISICFWQNYDWKLLKMIKSMTKSMKKLKFWQIFLYFQLSVFMRWRSAAKLMTSSASSSFWLNLPLAAYKKIEFNCVRLDKLNQFSSNLIIFFKKIDQLKFVKNVNTKKCTADLEEFWFWSWPMGT